MVLSMYGLWKDPETKSGRLLCVLLVRLCAVPAHSGTAPATKGMMLPRDFCIANIRFRVALRNVR
jgi:hypothetical protein